MGSDAEPSGPQFISADDLPWEEFKAQRHDDRHVAVWGKRLRLEPDRTFLYVRYDPGMVLERHGHRSDHHIFVIEGELHVGDHHCSHGTLVTLPHGHVFGPLVAGPEGCLLLEVYLGNPRPVSEDPDAFRSELAERGIEPLPDPQLDLPPWMS